VTIETAEDYGQAIREAREAKGWSQNELARRLSVSPQSVYNWEKKGRLPRSIVRKALRRMLGVRWLDDTKA